MVPYESVMAISFRRSHKKLACMSYTNDMSASVRKKGLTITFTGLNDVNVVS